jgi:hypothetical protein
LRSAQAESMSPIWSARSRAATETFRLAAALDSPRTLCSRR